MQINQQYPSGMLKAEADIILAIHHIKKRSPYRTRIRHVYGHQDTKKIPPQTKQQDNLNQQTHVLINIACDKIATNTSKNGIINKGNHPPLPPILTPPYERSRAMLRINDTWITSHYKGELYRARRTKLMENYLKAKYNWTNKTFNDIYSGLQPKQGCRRSPGIKFPVCRSIIITLSYLRSSTTVANFFLSS